MVTPNEFSRIRANSTNGNGHPGDDSGTWLTSDQERRIRRVVRNDLKIAPSAPLPAKRGYYTFSGSLTTPPCTEDVLWLVLKTPEPISKEQLAGFGTIYKNNVRPVQPVNNRVIKESR